MKNILVILSVVLLITSCGQSTKSNTTDDLISAVRYEVEKAYFEGQKDAINGDIRIKRSEFGNTWEWTKSPWDSGRTPVFKLKTRK